MTFASSTILAFGNHDFCFGITPITLYWYFIRDFSALIDKPLARVIKSPKERTNVLESPCKNGSNVFVFKNNLLIHAHTERKFTPTYIVKNETK